jgi:hypothetical protein
MKDIFNVSNNFSKTLLSDTTQISEYINLYMIPHPAPSAV